LAYLEIDFINNSLRIKKITGMSSAMENYITRTNSSEWKQLIENGVDTTGLYVKTLRFDPAQQRSPAIILKFEPGASYPYHNHPAGEEIFLIKGSCFVNETILKEGDYLYTPPGFKHGVKSETGCEMLLIIPKEVEILTK
jgi:quercetin dioxygenase-like cupin family protein